MTDVRLEKLVSELGIENKQVLVAEDNSNTGTTLSRISAALDKQKPKSINMSIAEFDPLRVEVKSKGHSTTATDVSHPDFKTAVSIVPITKNFLPDRQIRKTAAQKIVYRGLELAENNSWASLDENAYQSIVNTEGFVKFREVYKSILKTVGDKYGYRNPYMIALELYRQLAPAQYKKNINTPQEREILSAIATASIEYPYIPEILKEKLAESEETPEYTPGKLDSWMVAGAKNMIDACFGSVAKRGGKVYIWSKGDSHRIGYERLPGAGEQEKRFNISGLSKFISDGMAKHGLTDHHFKFMALPNKTRVIDEVVCPDAAAMSGSIFIIDDDLEQIKLASVITQNAGINTEPFLMDNEQLSQSLKDATSLIEKMDSPFCFVLDMDDTLLHEQFRKEHQPVNIYLEMQRLGLVN